jgi:enterobactin synthetase component D
VTGVRTNPPLFPAFVAQHTIAFDESASPAEQFPDLALPESLRNAVDKRKNEFLAGRFCAREALRQVAPELADVPIPVGAQRAPVWPDGIVGAITHARGFASVAIARSADARGIGLDAEIEIAVDVAPTIADTITAKDELDAAIEATGLPYNVALTVIFSAKETLFKALYPSVGRYFDFLEARIDPKGGVFQSRLLSDLTSEWTAGSLFQGRYLTNGLIVTAMVV